MTKQNHEVFLNRNGSKFLRALKQEIECFNVWPGVLNKWNPGARQALALKPKANTNLVLTVATPAWDGTETNRKLSIFWLKEESCGCFRSEHPECSG